MTVTYIQCIDDASVYCHLMYAAANLDRFALSASFATDRPTHRLMTYNVCMLQQLKDEIAGVTAEMEGLDVSDEK